MRLHYIFHPFVALVLSLWQWVFWFLFYPDIPMLEHANPKAQFGASSIFFWVCWFFFVVGVFVPPLLKMTTVSSFYIGRNCFFAMILAFASYLTMLYVVITTEDILTLFLNAFSESGASHRLYSEVLTNGSGLNVLSIFWLVILPFVYRNALAFPTIYRRILILFYIAGLLIYGMFFMSRMTFLIGLGLLFGSHFLISRGNVSISKRLFVIALSFVFGFTFLRSGVFYSSTTGYDMYSGYVISLIIQEWIEKYFAAETNNALLVIEYFDGIIPLYGTAFYRFSSEVLDLGFELNTMNVVGLWFIKTSYFSVLLFFFWGMIASYFYRIFLWNVRNGMYGMGSVVYIFIWIGFFVNTRVDYYFLYFFLAFLIYVLVVGIYKFFSGKVYVNF